MGVQTKPWAISACASLIASGAACGDPPQPIDPPPRGHASVTVLLAGTPELDIEEAKITLGQVYLQDEARADLHAGRAFLRDAVEPVELTSLWGDPLALAEDVEVPAGRWARMSFVLRGGLIRVRRHGALLLYATPGYHGVALNEPVRGPLLMDGPAPSGFEVELPEGGLELEEREARTFVLRFDVAESLTSTVMVSHLELWRFRPRLTLSEVEALGDLEVEIEALAEAPGAFAGAELFLFDAGGNLEGRARLEDQARQRVRFPWLRPEEGPFVLRMVAPGGNLLLTEPLTPLELEVRAGELTRRAIRARATPAP